MSKGIDKLLQGNRGRSEKPHISQDDLGGGKFMPQTGKLIPVSRIRPSPFQPRLQFEPDALRILSDSILAGGLDTPIIVRPIIENDEMFYELIDGQRRVTAIQALGWDEIAANIRELTDSEAAIQAYTASSVRVGFSDYESGKALKRLLDLNFVRSKTDLEKITGIGRGDIYRFIKLASLPDSILKILDLHPKLIGGSGGEFLFKIVDAGDAELAHKAVMLVLEGRLKETNIIAWWESEKVGRGTTTPIRRVAIRHDGDIYATMKENKKGGFDLSITPQNTDISKEKLHAVLSEMLKNLKLK